MWNKSIQKPLVILAIIFSSGIYFASKIKVNFLLVYVSAMIFLFLSFLAFKKKLKFQSDLFLCFFVFFVAVAVWKNSCVLSSQHISRRILYKNSGLYTVKGFIHSEPFFKNNKTTFIFRTEEIGLNNTIYNTCGNVIVHVKGKYDLDYGEELNIKGSLYRPFRFGAVKARSYRDYLYSQNIFAVMNVGLRGQIIRLNKKRGLLFKRLAFWLKKRAEDIFFKRLSFVSAGILDAMILGEKRNIPPYINNSMIKSGTVHILVVSGFNVGLVTFTIILFLKLMRIPRRMRFYIAAPLLIIYCFITGASVPVIRATIMAIIFMFAYLVKRDTDIYNSCALAAIFILGINPRQLFDAGFQLSFSSVISIVYLYPKMSSFFSADNLRIKFLRFLIDGCLVSLAAWLGTLGLIAYHFRIISPVTVLANIFIVPLASLITLCGFSLIIMEYICPILAPCFASSCQLFTALLLNINALLVKLPGASFYLSN